MRECNKDEFHCGPAPILLAAKEGHIQIAAHLLFDGARPQVRDCHGTTASSSSCVQWTYRAYDMVA